MRLPTVADIEKRLPNPDDFTSRAPRVDTQLLGTTARVDEMT